jgi:carboxymethylenebutenolidase
MMVTLEASFSRGICPIQAFGALNDQWAPIVLLFMDAFGPRPALFAIAERLAHEGYRVLMPHLFYDHLPYPPLDPKSFFSGGAEQQRLMAMFRALNQQMIDADIRALLSLADDRLGASAPIAATGYCMGGRFALTAAVASSRVVLAASFHGSNLALDRDDSPHRRLNGVKSRIYVGIAEVDPTFNGIEEGRLAEALREGGVDHVIETYARSQHGFVMEDLPVFNAVAAERHWARLAEHLRETFMRDGSQQKA